MMRRRRAWFLCSGVLLSLLAWVFVGHVNAMRHARMVQAAKVALSGHSTLEARRLLAEVTTSWPSDDEAAFLLGACEQSLGRPEAAAVAYARIPASSAFAAHAAMFRAKILLGRDSVAEAEPLLLMAMLGRGPIALEARKTLVNLFKMEGRFDEARTLVLGASDFYPDPGGLLREAETLGSNNPSAIEATRLALERASKNAPDDDRIWLGWANLAIRTGRFEDASRWLDRCLSRRPDDPAVWRAKLDWGLARESSEAVIEAARKTPPDRFSPSEVLNIKAWLAARSGDLEGERQAHEELSTREPGNLRSLSRLADLAMLEGRVEEAARLRDRHAKLNRVRHDYQALIDSLNPGNAQQAAEMAEELGRPVEALSLWSIVAQSEPGNREPLMARARIDARESSRRPGPTLRDLVAERDASPRRRPTTSAVATGLGPARFVDDAETSGLKFTFDNGASPAHQMPETMSGGVGLLDFNGDGWLDVYVVQAGPFPPSLATPETGGDRLFRNRGDGTFEDATTTSGLAAFARGYGHGVTVGDFDGDGRPDLFITRWRRYGLYRNRGDGTFEDRTESSGLGGERDWPTSAAFADLDDDGDLDLYVCHYAVWDEDRPLPCKNNDQPAYCSPQYSKARPDHLFRNDDGRFADISAEAGIVEVDKDGRGLGVVAADLDGDRKLDLFVANDQTANFLFRNKGGMRFEDVAPSAGVASNGEGTYQASMGIALGDLDGDGRPDLAKTNFYNESTTLYRNLGEGLFSDATAQVGLAAPSRHLLGFGVGFLDVENDGWLDLATANGHVDDPGAGVPYRMPAQLLLGDGRGRLVDASKTAGPPWLVPRIARGLAAGDLDNDGRVDLLILSQNSPLAYFHNKTTGGHRLTLVLEGTTSNRDAVGAEVRVEAGGRTRSAWRIGGGSYQSASDPRIHFGLGQSSRVDRVEVTWPSGRVDHFGPLEADAGYRIREGDSSPHPLRGFSSTAPGSARPSRSRRGDDATRTTANNP